MVWQVFGKHVEFEISEHGEFFVHGNAEKHFCRPSAQFQMGLDAIKKFRCSWEIHDGENHFRFAENIISSEKLIGRIKWNLVNESDAFLSEIKNGQSVASIEYSNINGDDNIIICMYFPEKIFSNVVDLLKFSSGIDRFNYIFSLDFFGFSSNSTPEIGRFISYENWLDGSPYYTKFNRFNISDYSELSCQSS